MPDIRVTCPTCKTQLEIDSAHEGEEVECGNCLQVFVATTKKPKDAGSSDSGGKVRGSTSKTRASRDDDDEDEDERPKRRRRRDDDDDDDDDYDPRPRRRSGGGNGLAVTSLVLGILSLPLCCCPLIGILSSISAIITGAIGMKNQESKGMAVAGLVLGIVGLILALINAFAGVAMNMNNMNNQNRFR